MYPSHIHTYIPCTCPTYACVRVCVCVLCAFCLRATCSSRRRVAKMYPLDSMDTLTVPTHTACTLCTFCNVISQEQPLSSVSSSSLSNFNVFYLFLSLHAPRRIRLKNQRTLDKGNYKDSLGWSVPLVVLDTIRGSVVYGILRVPNCLIFAGGSFNQIMGTF